MKLRNNIGLSTVILSLGTLIVSLTQAMVAEASVVSPTGTWKVTTINPQTKSKIGSEETLKIRLEAGQLTGTITHRSNVNGSVRVHESVIQDIKLQGSDISFAFSSEPFTGDWVEGPSAIKIGNEYLVYFDHYAQPQYYGAMRSTDLRQWEDCSTAMSFPKGQRHGTVLRIPQRIARALMALE